MLKYFLKIDIIELVFFEIVEFFMIFNRIFCEDFLVLILIFIYNSERDIENYVNFIRMLNYFKNRFLVVLGEDGSNDRMFLKVKNVIEVFRFIGFCRVDVFYFNFIGGLEINSWMKEYFYVN